ncbi:neuropeptides capa receptor-like [Cloeon dipterum]|uniref:neuropeptides capa receptor-like n=1 Tax=Cloeon dipterum TaxID=197152 RepID=UPI00321F94F4
MFNKTTNKLHFFTIPEMPNEVYINYLKGNQPWTLGGIVCKLTALIPETATNASVLTILAFSVERYVAICYPLRSLALSHLRRAKRILTAIWLTSLVCAVPFCLDFELISVNAIQPSLHCDATGLILKDYYMGIISSVLFFIIPFAVMVYLYSRIAMVVRSRKSIGESRTLDASTKSVIRMLAAVVFSFFLCWAPFHFQRLFFAHLSEQTIFLAEINHLLYVISGFSFYLSSTLNPILYNVMSAKYRNAFKATLYGRIV